MIHYGTAAIIAAVSFFAGFVLTCILKDERILSLCAKLAAALVKNDELTTELGELNRQYYDLEHVLEMRVTEVHRLRAEVLKLRGGLRVVPEGPGAA